MMDIQTLIEGMSRPDAYPHAVAGVTVVQTHISAVFLAGDMAYKVKKAVDFGFLDFTTLERRRHYCAEEVRLNRRLAPHVYLDVVPIVQTASGVSVGGAGRPVEYAVRMARLPDESTFAAMLARGELDAGRLADLATRIASFHASAARGPDVSRWGGFDTVAMNVRENFEQIRGYIGDTLSAEVFERLQGHAENDLSVLRSSMEHRAERDVPCEGHGDLHLKHVYALRNAPPPGDLVVVDCIEFNERFRYADPVSDVAFVDMDLRFHGRPDLACAFCEAWFRASGDDEGRQLLPFYSAYRAVVRGKVDGFATRDAEIPQEERGRLLTRARAHFLLALGIASSPADRPALVVVSGLPGTGKSTITRWLETQGWTAVSTDVTRKALAGLAPGDDARAEPDQGIYAPDWSERTYAAVLEQATRWLLAGRRVVVEGTFLQESRRRMLLDAAGDLRVPGLLLQVDAPAHAVRDRLAARRHDASDADWRTFEAVLGRQEPFGRATDAVARIIDNSGSPDQALDAVRAALASAGLAGAGPKEP